MASPAAASKTQLTTTVATQLKLGVYYPSRILIRQIFLMLFEYSRPDIEDSIRKIPVTILVIDHTFDVTKSVGHSEKKRWATDYAGRLTAVNQWWGGG